MQVDWASGRDGPGPTLKNADRVAAVERPGLGWVFLVADGAGGSGDGVQAASTLAERFVAFTLKDHRDGQPLDEAETWVDFLADIDIDLSRAETFGESTAVVLAVTPDRIVGASVGDSGALLHQPEAPEPWRFLTAHQQRKPLVGSGGAWPIGFRAPHRGGTLLLASDGLWNYAHPDAVRGLIVGDGPLDDLPDALIDLVRLRGGRLPDDIGIIVARITPLTCPRKLAQGL